MKKTLLIIGGTGFLGQSFFDYINEDKLKNIRLSEIIIISRKRKKIKSNIKISYIVKNITDVKEIPFTDYIIYAANSKNNLENLKGINNFPHSKIGRLFFLHHSLSFIPPSIESFAFIDPGL